MNPSAQSISRKAAWTSPAAIGFLALLAFGIANRTSRHVLRSGNPPVLWVSMVTNPITRPNAWLDGWVVVSNPRPRQLPAGLTVVLEPLSDDLRLEVEAAATESQSVVDRLVLPGLPPGGTHSIPIRVFSRAIGEKVVRTIVEEGLRKTTNTHPVRVEGIPLDLAIGTPETVRGTQIIIPVAVRNRSAFKAPAVRLATRHRTGMVLAQTIDELGPEETRTVFLSSEIPDDQSLSFVAEASGPSSLAVTSRITLPVAGLRDRSSPIEPCIPSVHWQTEHRDALPPDGKFPPFPFPIAAAIAGESGVVDIEVDLSREGIPVVIAGKGPVNQSILLSETARWIRANWSWPAGYRTPVKLPLFRFQLEQLKTELD